MKRIIEVQTGVSYSAPMAFGRKRHRAPDRLAGWLRWWLRQKGDSAVWCRVQFGTIAKALGLSERTIRRSKGYLMEHVEHYGLVFVTIRGKDSWEVLFSEVSRLKFDMLPLFRRIDGKSRRLRPMLMEQDFEEPDRSDFSHSSMTGTTYKGEYQQESIINRPAGPVGALNLARGSTFSAKSPQQREKYHHSLARWVGSTHWDNCKIRLDHRSLVSVVRKLTEDGFLPSMIRSAYSAALHEVHGLCTDMGLNMGKPDLKWYPPPVYFKLYESLGYEAVDTDEGVFYFLVHTEIKEAYYLQYKKNQLSYSNKSRNREEGDRDLISSEDVRRIEISDDEISELLNFG